jgi:hypothetical protein
MSESKIIEITSFKQLYELSGAGAAGGYSLPLGATPDQEKKRENDMIKREDIVAEQKLREYIRSKLKENVNKEKSKRILEEQQLRQVIRSILSESDISDVHPHASTGINVLEDLLKKMIPTLRTDYKRLTTSKDQRDSFRAHIINATKQSIMPSLVNDMYAGGVEKGDLLSSPDGDEYDIAPEPEFEADVDGMSENWSGVDEGFEDLNEDEELLEADIDVMIDDEPSADKKISVEPDDEKDEEDEFGSEILDKQYDETGRNMAFTSFKKVQQYILDSYDLLRDPADKKVFVDYLITNLKLYMDKFEDELQTSVEEPTTPAYEKTQGNV